MGVPPKNNLKTSAVKKQVKKAKDKGEAPKVYNLIKETPTSPVKGERFSTCKTCGNKFEQDYVSERNAYSNYKTCLDCRRVVRSKKEKEVSSSDGTLVEGFTGVLEYTPYPWQRQAHKDFNNVRFQVLACGVRTGKDRYTNTQGIMYFIECLNENRHIDNPELVPAVYWWQIAPTEKIALQNWRELKKFFPKQWVVAVSDTTMTMQTIGGGVIEVRSAYDPESLVSVGLDLVTITEAARIKDLETVWANLEGRLSSPGRGRTKDRNGRSFGCGKAIINSSPLGKNYFYKMWCWGQKNHGDYSSGFISYQLPWTANPSNAERAAEIIQTKYGPMTTEEDMRRRLGRRYEQDFMASFEAVNGTVFKDFEENCVINLFSGEYSLMNPEQRKDFIREWVSPNPHKEYRLAWDIATGSSSDSPTLGIMDMEEKKIVRIFDLYGKGYDEQYDTIAYWSKLYNNAPCVYSLTGHTAVEGQLAKRGVYEITVNEQGENKKRFVLSLERAVQNSAFKILHDGSNEICQLIFQMNDYTELNGKYGNNGGDHDDFVSMLYLMFHDFELEEDKNPFFGLIIEA